MVILTCGLLLILLLKLIAILNAIMWLVKHGRTYKTSYLITKLPRTRARYYRALKRCSGAFFPFGLKDFELHRYIEKTGKKKGMRKHLTVLAHVFQALCFRFNKLTLLVAAYLLIASDLIGFQWFDWPLTKEQHLYALIALALLMVISNIFLSVEAIYSYAVLGSYAVSFHLLSPETDRWSGGAIIIIELKVFIQKLISTLIAGAVACYVAQLGFKAFSGNIAGPTSAELQNRLKTFLQCIYFTVTTFTTVGYGDIQPGNGLGQLIAFLLMIQSFVLVIIVLASLLSSRQQEDQ